MQPESSTLAALDGRAGIADVGYRFLWAIDTRDWDRLLSACEAGVAVEWGDPTGVTRSWRSAAETCEGLRLLLGACASHHQATNQSVKVEGSSAELAWLVVGRYRASILRGDDSCTVCAEQRIALKREAGVWKISSIRHANLSVDGNPAVVLRPAQTPSVRVHSFFTPQPPPSNETEVQCLTRLADGNAIFDLMMRFGRALDQKDWTAYRSCFAERLILDFSLMTGEPAHDVDADLFVEFARMRQRAHASFHQYSNFQVGIEGDRARCLLYMVARHRIAESGRGDPLNVFVGWYENEFARGPDGWKVSVLRTPLQWVEGNALIKDAPDPEVAEISRRLFTRKEVR